MKTKHYLIFAVVSVLLISCTQEPTLDELNAESSTFSTADENEKTYFDCNPNYVFRIHDSRANFHQSNVFFTIEYDRSLTLAEIACIRQEYFSQEDFDLALVLPQPEDPYQDRWSSSFGQPGQSTSTTIGTDPRLFASTGSGSSSGD